MRKTNKQRPELMKNRVHIDAPVRNIFIMFKNLLATRGDLKITYKTSHDTKKYHVRPCRLRIA